jgi:IS5 family transposase
VKNGQTKYGYKNGILVDRRSKLIQAYSVTPASVHDSQMVKDLLAGGQADGQKLYGDSAYSGKPVEALLEEHSIRSRIHAKGCRGRKLLARQKAANKVKSRTRARVEHIFAFMTRSMGGKTVNCRSLRRAEAVIEMMNITYNLCRVAQLGHSLEIDVG